MIVRIYTYYTKVARGLRKIIIALSVMLYLTSGFVFAQDNSDWVIDADNQRKFDFYFYDALSAKAQGNYDEALNLLQHCHALDSTNAAELSDIIGF